VKPQVSRPALAALLLALAPRPATGQLVTIGPQVVLADYREVASGLRYRGTGVGGALWARRDRFSLEAAVTRVSLDPTDGSTATAGFTATQVDAWVAYDVAAYASVEVGVLHRGADPEFDAQSVGAVRSVFGGIPAMLPQAVTPVGKEGSCDRRQAKPLPEF
jgi:hypothetical protein